MDTFESARDILLIVAMVILTIWAFNGAIPNEPKESDYTVVATDVQATVISRTDGFLEVDYLIDVPGYGRATLNCTPGSAIYKEGDILVGQVQTAKTKNYLEVDNLRCIIHEEVSIKENGKQ